MVFQYTPAQTAPPKFRGVDNAPLAALLRSENDGLIKGMSILGQAMGAIQQKQKKEAQQNFLASIGGRIEKASSIDTRPIYEILGDQWHWIGDQQTTKQVIDTLGRIDADGNTISGSMKSVVDQESGRSRFVAKMDQAEGWTATEKQSLWNKLNSKTHRRVVNESEIHAIMAEAHGLGIESTEIARAIEMYGGNLHVGEENMLRDVQDDMDRSGYADIDFDNQHPDSIEFQFAPDAEAGHKLLINVMIKHGWINAVDQAGKMDMVGQILASGGSHKEVTRKLKNYLGNPPQRTLDVMDTVPRAAPSGSSRGVNMGQLQKIINVLGKGLNIRDVEAELVQIGDKGGIINADGSIGFPGFPRFEKMLNDARLEASPEQKARILETLNDVGDPMKLSGSPSNRNGRGYPGGIDPYSHLRPGYQAPTAVSNQAPTGVAEDGGGPTTPAGVPNGIQLYVTKARDGQDPPVDPGVRRPPPGPANQLIRPGGDPMPPGYPAGDLQGFGSDPRLGQAPGLQAGPTARALGDAFERIKGLPVGIAHEIADLVPLATKDAKNFWESLKFKAGITEVAGKPVEWSDHLKKQMVTLTGKQAQAVEFAADAAVQVLHGMMTGQGGVPKATMRRLLKEMQAKSRRKSRLQDPKIMSNRRKSDMNLFHQVTGGVFLGPSPKPVNRYAEPPPRKRKPKAPKPPKAREPQASSRRTRADVARDVAGSRIISPAAPRTNVKAAKKRVREATQALEALSAQRRATSPDKNTYGLQRTKSQENYYADLGNAKYGASLPEAKKELREAKEALVEAKKRRRSRTVRLEQEKVMKKYREDVERFKSQTPAERRASRKPGGGSGYPLKPKNVEDILNGFTPF